MLQNACFLAKNAFDTAEKEPAKKLHSIAGFCKEVPGSATRLPLFQAKEPGDVAEELAGRSASERTPRLEIFGSLRR